MHNRWLQSIPDELTDEILSEVDDPLERAELQELHQKLRMMDADNTRREGEIRAKGIQRSTAGELNVRFNLLVEMFIGAVSVERLKYEIKFQEALRLGIEEGYNDFLQRQRAQILHTPQGQVIVKGDTDDGPVSSS